MPKKKAKPDDEQKQRTAQEDDDQFISGLLERGEAVKPDCGELPPGATHEIVEDDKGTTTVKRRRFSAF